ncbi:Do family serine endopeptidase [Citreimonas salinaria]|uniref:Probable periplasmic serine endoprotease DegP-like n=1 Tax=Citreimonas salinaria TaxID=321339 RepID=A0A1H3KPD5_9RHOB|nr:Do family serine endopeptidase [Citreimonas salinaria]SDY53585.1 serine protease Do [Citreimonas salinaria]
MSPMPKSGRMSAAAVALALSLTAIEAPAQEATRSAPADFTAMVEEKLPAVVGIRSTGPSPQTSAGGMPGMPPGMPGMPPGFDDFFGDQMPRQPQGPMRSQGSGFIISADGYVVTNNHVVADAEQVQVVLDDEREYDAEVIGTDPATDIALLKIDAEEDLPTVEWGSSDDLKIGQWVVAIGNPFGLGGTVTAGIVSARSRDINSGPYDDFIQTDAAINSGNSGGPLFNAPGEVVGVNTAIFSPSGGNVGIGFAVPSAVAQRIVEDLREDGSVERGWLGVQIQSIDDALAEALDLADTTGVLVSDATAGGPAAEAGLQAGDVIVSVAGEDVSDPRGLTFAVADLPVGEPVAVTYLRDGERQEAEVTLGERPDMGMSTDPAAPEQDALPDGPTIGVAIQPVTPQLRSEMGLPSDLEGLAVASVDPESPAAEAGLRQGDVIVQAAGQPVPDVAALREAAAAAEEEGEPLLLRIYRDGGYAFRAVTFPENAAD